MPRATTRTAQQLVDDHIHFIGRYLRHLGVPEHDVEDAVQVVFVTATRKLERIEPGRERSFLVAVALRVASKSRRSLGRRREVLDEELLERRDPSPTPDELASDRRALAALDRILEDMSLDLRAVFVLFEIEELEVAEIASMLDVPQGTVSSRLRRAREDFRARVRRYQLKNGLPTEDEK
ncbi:RNA polymerase sigma factor RpoE [Labilithrix luteola]|uniref:RNA polymerase sigma factor RpoE n=1 Tax=Labilithrix luteola TaxID=1391654 RepID=A0A0K1PQQ5_9BACT|nr:sigma-70 family RNA polymerase sigma factor [Labilithrix luteola]AKU95875.1 RNA polymerase sigma factor RpoE [Labilithrix luteola]